MNLLAAYEMLSYYESVVLVRCFVYGDRIRVGYAAFAPMMPARVSLRDLRGDRIGFLTIPQQFRRSSESVTFTDRHKSKFNASPRMITFEFQPAKISAVPQSLQQQPTVAAFLS